jgi:hypothetical protein
LLSRIARAAALLDRQWKIVEQLDAHGADTTLAMDIYIALGNCLDAIIAAENLLTSGRGSGSSRS